jgi:hypothetical protein
LVQEDSIHCEAGDLPAIKLKDKGDLAILSAAVSGGVNVIVTGDKEMQEVDRVAGIKIMSPPQSWQELVERKCGIGAAFVGDFLKSRTCMRKTCLARLCRFLL